MNQIATIFLGYDYYESAKNQKTQYKLLNLKEFGDVITEQNRIDILDLMLERKEVTIKDLERLLNFTGSTAYYHLTMMMRLRMVKTRNQGRTVLYSINEQYFESIVGLLSKYFEKGEQIWKAGKSLLLSVWKQKNYLYTSKRLLDQIVGLAYFANKIKEEI